MYLQAKRKRNVNELVVVAANLIQRLFKMKKNGILDRFSRK